jgi:hypothetical protein
LRTERERIPNQILTIAQLVLKYRSTDLQCITMAIEDRLTGFLKDARDWQRKATNIPGVFLLKLPSYRTRQAAIAIEINPVDSAGSATKKRGIVVRSASELEEFNRILANQKLVELAKKVDEVNPRQKEATTIGRSDVFEI